MAVFSAGQRLTAQLLNNQFQSLQAHSPLDSGTVTSTTFTQTRSGATSPVGKAFVAPTSGIVRVSWHSACRNATNFSLCSMGIRTGGTVGSGTDYLAPTDDIALQWVTNSADYHFGMSHPVGGLTAGSTYNAVLWFRVGSGTGTFSRCSIDIVPES